MSEREVIFDSRVVIKAGRVVAESPPLEHPDDPKEFLAACRALAMFLTDVADGIEIEAGRQRGAALWRPTRKGES